MRPKPFVTRRELLIALAALWFIAVVLAYFAVNKPLEPGSLIALVRLGRTAVGWAATVALANLIGRTQRERLVGFRAAERLALQVGLGFGALSVVLLGLGALQAYSIRLFWLMVLLPLPAGLALGWRDLQAARRPPPRLGAPWLFVLAAGAAALLSSQAPAVAWDSLVYHLTGPKLYLGYSGLVHPVDLPYLGFPKTGSMLLMLGLALGGDPLAQLLHLTFAGLTLTLLPRLLRPFAPSRGPLAAALLVGVPSIWLIAGWAYVEWITAFWLIAGFVLVTSDHDDGPALAALAGACAGFAVATKYTAVWMVAGLTLVALLRRFGPPQLAAFAAGAAAAMLPSLAANALLTGNPLYPFLFDGVSWDAHRAAWFSRFGTGLAPARLLLAPLEATVFGVEGGYYLGYPSYGATIGPLLLALAPLALLRWAVKPELRRGSMRDLAVMIAVGGAGWIAQLGASQLLVQTRLLFPLFPFLAAAGAIGYETLGQLSRRVQYVLGGLVTFVLAIALAGYFAQALGRGVPGVVTGSLSTDEYLTDRLAAHYLAMTAVSRLPAGSRVQFLWEPRSYYCDGQVVCEPDALLDAWWHARQHASDAEAIRSRWLEQGTTHLLIYWDGAEAVRQEGFDPLTEADWQQLDHLLDRLPAPEAEIGDSYALYPLR